MSRIIEAVEPDGKLCTFSRCFLSQPSSICDAPCARATATASVAKLAKRDRVRGCAIHSPAVARVTAPMPENPQILTNFCHMAPFTPPSSNAGTLTSISARAIASASRATVGASGPGLPPSSPNSIILTLPLERITPGDSISDSTRHSPPSACSAPSALASCCGASMPLRSGSTAVGGSDPPAGRSNGFSVASVSSIEYDLTHTITASHAPMLAVSVPRKSGRGLIVKSQLCGGDLTRRPQAFSPRYWTPSRWIK
mmetsp:Transcript_33042/g.74655  ORF Transcript_33042/g.74655 Transcript_33042/m.74655 type:complete len:255 (+) Transcript_33042:191-955(+)